MLSINRYFHLEERGTTVATEVRAGFTTFLTMAYILFVNPQILSLTGMPAADVAVATALAAALATLMMGLFANFPFALAPGMGLNAYFTFGVVQGMGVEWPVALTAVLIEGVLFMALAMTGVRTLLVNAIPRCIKIATITGIGLFLAIIGFENAKLTVDHPATLVTLGDLNSPAVLLALGGIILIAALMVKQIKGAVLIGILVLTLISWVTGLSPAPNELVAMPHLPRETLLAIDFSQVFTGTMLTVIIAFLFVDLFDTAGTLLGVGRLAGFLDDKGNLPGSERAFMADATGTTAGALLGTSTVTTYVESATGIEEGGRTGLTAVVVAALFLLSLFFTPLFTSVPALATAPALIVVGAMMMLGARDLDWTQMDEAVPAFLTVVAMPFTYSIAHGITLGIVSYVLIHLVTGQTNKIHPVMWVLAALLIAFHAL
ncbi:MAG: NCS2 family permease [Gammaproteobacteria bacterium]|nr:MAG: NCS2 family permease [Gammaproteobacteria bacterium]